MLALLSSSQNTRRASIRSSPASSTAGPDADPCRPRLVQDRNRVLDNRKKVPARTYQVKPTWR